MRLQASILLLTLAILAPLASARGYQNVPPEDIYNTTERRYGHLQYMGFYASAMRQWNFTEELAEFTNLTWVENANFDNILVRIEEAENAGVQVVLGLQTHIFDADYQLKPDYLASISTIQQLIMDNGLMDSIAMVYPLDEPFSHAANSNATNRAQMYEDLVEVNEEIEQLFPEKPIGVIFNHKEIFRSDFRIPLSYSWVGFDCYDNLFDCNLRPHTDYYSKMLEKMTPEQLLMAVPETWVRYRDFERNSWESSALYEQRKKSMVRSLRKRLKQHYEIALSEPRFVAFIPFIWSMEVAAGKPQKSGFGADQFEANFPEGGTEFINLLTKIGDEIKFQDYRYPNMSLAQTDNSLFRPRAKFEGEILQVTGKGKISAWAVDSAMPHTNLRVQLAVVMDGVEIYSSNLKRTFILDDSLSSSYSPRLSAIGIHGYRHTLPRNLVESLEDESVVIEFRIFPDRANRLDYELIEYPKTF